LYNILTCFMMHINVEVFLVFTPPIKKKCNGIDEYLLFS
jgi:hypothetical protein